MFPADDEPVDVGLGDPQRAAFQAYDQLREF
jgi:hypothetical protein